MRCMLRLVKLLINNKHQDYDHYEQMMLINQCWLLIKKLIWFAWKTKICCSKSNIINHLECLWITYGLFSDYLMKQWRNQAVSNIKYNTLYTHAIWFNSDSKYWGLVCIWCLAFCWSDGQFKNNKPKFFLLLNLNIVNTQTTTDN